MKKKIRLKNGREVVLRFLTSEDVDGLYEMFASMSDEALRYGLPPYTRKRIESWLNTPSLIPVGAEHEGHIIGFTCIEKFTHSRLQGIGYLGIYFHQNFYGIGLEPQMMENLLDVARHQGVHKVNTEVAAEDEASISLLVKFGFETEGRKRDAYFGEDGMYYDIIVMGKILEPDANKS